MPTKDLAKRLGVKLRDGELKITWERVPAGMLTLLWALDQAEQRQHAKQAGGSSSGGDPTSK